MGKKSIQSGKRIIRRDGKRSDKIKAEKERAEKAKEKTIEELKECSQRAEKNTNMEKKYCGDKKDNRKIGINNSRCKISNNNRRNGKK